MKAGFHYVVKLKLIRNKNPEGLIFMEFEELFENDNPIIARDAAFYYYQNYIDILLEGKGEIYFSDKQAREKLQSFIDPGTSTKIKFRGGEIEFKDSFGNGIGVFLVIDIPIEQNSQKGDEILVHGIGYQTDCLNDPNFIISNLEEELKLYKISNYDTKNKEKEIIYCNSDEWEEGYREDEPSKYNILETPFDWTGYDKPYWWGEPAENTLEVQQEATSLEEQIKQIIEEDEGHLVEFKPSFLYYYDKEGIKSGYRMFVRHIIAKVISSFLNSDGGFLLIGVQDNKEIIGLKDDFSLARPEGKDPKDYFLIEVDRFIRDYFKGIASNISGEFVSIDGVEIYIFKVFPSKNHPVFITGQNGKEFYARWTTSCEPYKDIEELITYCLNKWGS